MDILTRFGVGAYEYTFYSNWQISYRDNFGDAMPPTIRFPGMDGGVYLPGFNRPKAEVGNVQVYYWLHADDAVQLAALVADIRSIAAYPMARLFKTDRNGLIMWTWAICNSVDFSQSAQDRNNIRQRVQINFQCPVPRWYHRTGQLFFNDGATFNDGLSFPSPKVDRADVANGDTVSITNNGNAPAPAYVRWDAGANPCENPTLTRYNEHGQIVDRITYSALLSAQDVAIIDAQRLAVSPDYTRLTATSGAWLELPPGSTTLYITGDFTGDVKLTVDCWDSYI